MIDKKKLVAILNGLWMPDSDINSGVYNMALQDVQNALYSLQEEPSYKYYRCTVDCYPNFTNGKVYRVFIESQDGAEWITDDLGHSYLFGYLKAEHFKQEEDSIQTQVDAFNINDPEFWEDIFGPCKLPAEEPVSCDLEKEIKRYFNDWYFDDELDILAKPNHYSATIDDIKDIARHFVNWQKNQMMKDAIKTTIKAGTESLGIFIKGLDRNKYSFGDKIKVIIIKQEEE